MNEQNLTDKTKADRNADPITGEPGAHPVATGLGAAGAGLAGAAIGTAVAGPVGTIVGAVVGAVAGGYGGKAAGEAIDPTVEDAYWREAHGRQSYGAGTEFDTYHPAYRVGYEGAARHIEDGMSFEDSEEELRTAYDAGAPRVTWMQARSASRAAWDRVAQRRAGSARE